MQSLIGTIRKQAAAKYTDRNESSSIHETFLLLSSPLHRAARDCDIAALQKAVDNGQKINSQWMLFVAIKYSKRAREISNTVKLILDQEGTNPNQLDYDHRTPLFWAVEKWHQETVKTLIEHGADPYIADNKGETPFHIAARHADICTMEILLSKELKPQTLLNAYNKSPLCIISENELNIVPPRYINPNCINPAGVLKKLLESFDFDPADYVHALRLAIARDLLPPIKYLLNHDITNIEDSAKIYVKEHLSDALVSCNFNKDNWPVIVAAFLEKGVNLDSAIETNRNLRAKLKDVDNVGKIIEASDNPEKQILCALSLLEYSVDQAGIKEYILNEVHKIFASIKDTNQAFVDECLELIKQLTIPSIQEDLNTTLRLAAFNENSEVVENVTDDTECVVLDVKELGQSLQESTAES